MEEIWKPIPGFNRYHASNLGRLKSLTYKNTKKERLIKPALSPDGYLQTMLLDDTGKYRTWKIHRWIAHTFLGTRPTGLEINHKDGNKTNNSIINLEYCTRSANIKHSYLTKLRLPPRGSTNGWAKLKESDVIEIRDYVKTFPGKNYGRQALADKYGVSSAHIKDIVNRRRNIWPHV